MYTCRKVAQRKHFFIQFCPEPSCNSGASLNKQACKCFTESTCLAGFIPVKSSQGCSCARKTNPQCPSGLSIYGSDCMCTGNPTCPGGSTLSHSSATCSAAPYCPFGGALHHCKCVKEYGRRCPWGTLSWDGCECKTLNSPTCSSGCSLDSNGGCECSIQNKSKNCLWQKAHVNIIYMVGTAGVRVHCVYMLSIIIIMFTDKIKLANVNRLLC